MGEGVNVMCLSVLCAVGRCEPLYIISVRHEFRRFSEAALILIAVLLSAMPSVGRGIEPDFAHQTEFNGLIRSFAAYRSLSKLCFMGETTYLTAETEKILRITGRNGLSTRARMERVLGGYEELEATKTRRNCVSIDAARNRYFVSKMRYGRFVDRFKLILAKRGLAWETEQ